MNIQDFIKRLAITIGDFIEKSDSLLFAASHGGFERWLQTELAQKIMVEFTEYDVFPENARRDIVLFDKSLTNHDSPDFIIELGTNYLCQKSDIMTKPFNDVGKFIDNNHPGSVVQIMLISDWEGHTLPSFLKKLNGNEKYTKYIFKPSAFSISEIEDQTPEKGYLELRNIAILKK
tara:strand:+ start:5207 stop:5734 length:528 start_codon:yes stop_codon:yes gene_type:complete